MVGSFQLGHFQISKIIRTIHKHYNPASKINQLIRHKELGNTKPKAKAQHIQRDKSEEEVPTSVLSVQKGPRNAGDSHHQQSNDPKRIPSMRFIMPKFKINEI